MFLIVVILLVLLVLVLGCSHRDTFTETPMLVLRVDRSPLNIHVHNPLNIKVPPVDHVLFKKSSCNDCNARITTAYDMMIQGGAKLLAVLPSEQTVVFVKQRNFDVNETLHDVLHAEKTIGYRDPAHKHIILAMAASMGHKKVNFTERPADAYVMCYVQTIEEHQLKTDMAFPDILDLGSFSPDILRAIFPFVLIRNKDFARYVNGYQDRFSIKTCIAFHNVIVGNTMFDEVKYAPTILAMRRSFGVGPDVLEFYNMLAQRNKKIVEGFISLYEAKSNVPGFFDSKQGVFYPDELRLDGLHLDTISRVNLSRQENPEQNGIYKTSSGRKLVRISPAPPAIPADYKCVGKPDLINREQCDRGGGIWDRPCVKNEECPFFQANRTYRNYRGGCIDGSCEMPLGVQRIAFRGHGTKDAAICHGCPIGNPLCCAEQVRPDYAFPLDYFERTQ
jgi:hypothetical protein